MEVLASTFVIGVGLMGVLAVIPFGAFQVSKANNADYSANMLRNAVNDVLVREMAKPENWHEGESVNSNLDTVKVYVHNKSNGDKTLNCQRIIMFDPLDGGTTNPTNIYKIGRMLSSPTVWKELMRGQDDLQFTVPDDKRTVLTTSASMPYISSGKYTWFFTFKPKETSSNEPLDNVSPVSVDVLACFNRLPGDTTKERTVAVASWKNYLSGAELTLQGTPSELAVENTKWILVTWTENSAIVGSWCKIVSRGAGGGTTRVVTVVGDLPSTKPDHAFIVDGVLDHARIDNVPLQ